MVKVVFFYRNLKQVSTFIKCLVTRTVEAASFLLNFFIEILHLNDQGYLLKGE